MNKTIQIRCEGAGHLTLDEMTPFQGNLKSLSKEQYKQLRDAILDTGFAFPIHIWKSPDGVNYILGGHQRHRVLVELRTQGYVIPPIPVSFVEASTYQEAKKRVLQDVSQYGVVETQGMYEFLDDAGMTLPDFEKDFKIPDFDMSKFKMEFFDENQPREEDNPYTSKIESPIYQITGEKPSISSLSDISKYTLLIEEINNSEIPEQEKEFLRLAATRHIIFSYSKIAEYYAHTGKHTQELMEKSALVIIDFDKAIQNGFVKLTGDLAAVYEEDSKK